MTEDQLSSIHILPVTVTRRGWLDREAMRIAAGVHGATRRAVAWQVFGTAKKSGASDDAAQREVERALVWIEARIMELEALMKSQPAMPASVQRFGA